MSTPPGEPSVPDSSQISDADLPRTPTDRLAVFCDFDGTFSVQDVGSTLARRYLPDRRAELWKRYERGELAAWDYLVELFDGFSLPADELDGFLRGIELDPGARGLVDWCDARGIPFEILSDGFDYNLERLQVLHGVQFEFRSNHLRYHDGTWRVSPGGRNPDCGCGTGTCKRRVIAAHRARHPDTLCVHVGNGRVSDLCGALAADLAFAKETLADALREQRQPYAPFTTLDDVVEGLRVVVGGASLPSATSAEGTSS